jgi:DNA polymerase III epsilon subunit-like protein
MAEELLARAHLAVLDLETTGDRLDRIIEIGLVVIRALRISETWTTLVNPRVPIPPAVLACHGLSQTDFDAAPAFGQVAGDLASRLSAADALVCHNAGFDIRHVQRELLESGHSPVETAVIDTLAESRKSWGRGENTLGEVAGRLGVSGEHRHRALDDARLTAGVLIEFACRKGEGFRLADFPGYRESAAIYSKPARPPAAAQAAAGRAYASVARDAEAQHGSVLRVLLVSAARAGREVGVVYMKAGRGLCHRRLRPIRVDQDHLVARGRAGEPEETLALAVIREVRW